MTRILAIDPGNTESAYVVIDAETRQPVEFAKVPNRQLLVDLTLDNDLALWSTVDVVAIEMIASYGMPVGAEIFETCVWIGRFSEAIANRTGTDPQLVKRNPVKVHHCHSSKAKDSNVTQALVDRFTPGQRNHGKGTKAEPGWFCGFAKDVWQAYALAVYVADITPLPVPSPAVGASPVATAGEATTPQIPGQRQEVLFT